MDQMIIESTSVVDSSMPGWTPVARILRYFRERLQCLDADMLTLMRAINDGDCDAITKLEAEIRHAYGWPDLDGAG